jgi:hypothetical protein
MTKIPELPRLVLAVVFIAASTAVQAEGAVARAGKPGPRMLSGTSVMSPAENQLAKSIGFSHSQTDSDHLIVNEISPGVWDWTNADAGLAAMKAAGMGWQYFPHFQWPPQWYRNTDKFVPCVGLRSKRTLAAISIWSPDIGPWFDHGYASMEQHYGNGTNNVYAIYLGIHGDFGETIFPMGWHPDEVKRFGTNGTGLQDFWCGDASARNDFRDRMHHKYHSLAKLNAAWGTDFKNVAAVDYPPAASDESIPIGETPQSRRYWLDFIGWYFDSMTRFTGEVCKIARNHFPKALLEIPVGGGNENLMYGQDTTALPKIAKRYGVHVRSTHGGYNPFPLAYASMIKRIATPCKIYDVPHWLEPPGAITPDGEVARIMEALSCGNYGFWDWGANPMGAAQVFRDYTNFFTRETPVVDVAMFFPTTDHRLHLEPLYPSPVQAAGHKLRDMMDFDTVDEELIMDDALKHYRVLVWAGGRFIEEPALKKIAKWVKHGGVVVFQNGVLPETVEGSTKPGSDLLDVTKLSVNVPNGRATPHGKGWVMINSGKGDSFDDLVRYATYHLSQLDSTKRDALEIDNEADGVYATLLANGEAILYNSNPKPCRKTVAGQTIDLPPNSLRSLLIAPNR